MIDLFKALSDIFTKNKARLLAEHQQFLQTFKAIVNVVSNDTAKAFGRLSVDVIHQGQHKTWAIELTPTDQMWWKDAIENEEARFKQSCSKILVEMLEHLTDQVKVLDLNQEERQLLLDVMNNDNRT